VTLEPRQRRVARAEVVEHDAHAERLEVVQRPVGGHVGAEEGGFRDLQDQLGHRETSVRQRLAHDACEAGLGQLLGRHVHAQLECAAGLRRQGRDRFAAFAQHPGAKRHDRAGLLGQRDELAGRDLAELRMAPAQQRLHAQQLAPHDLEQRLEHEAHLAARRRAADLGDQGHPPAGARVRSVAKEAHAVAARALGVVHRAVGLADGLARIGRTLAADQRDADAGGHRHVLERVRDGVKQAAADLGRLLGVAHATRQNDELVAAEAPNYVVLPHRGGQARAHGADQLVRAVVTEVVVQLF
jgi:hypothetical protein